MPDYEALISAAAAAVRSHGLIWYEKRRPAASPEAISQCETAIGTMLPSSYSDFLRQHDGLMLVIRLAWYAEYFIELLGTQDLVARTAQIADSVADGFPNQSFDGLIVFADIMDGDLCLFDRSQAVGEAVPVVVADHEEDPLGWRRAVIADDFTTWFANVLRFVTEWREHNEFRYWWVPEWSPH